MNLLLLSLIPFALMTLMAALAVVAVPTQLAAERITMADAGGSVALYAAGAVLGVATVVWSLLDRQHAPWVILLGLAAAGCMSAGPLLWGRAIREFHLSHHLVRGAALLLSLGLLSLYVLGHR